MCYWQPADICIFFVFLLCERFFDKMPSPPNDPLELLTNKGDRKPRFLSKFINPLGCASLGFGIAISLNWGFRKPLFSGEWKSDVTNKYNKHENIILYKLLHIKKEFRNMLHWLFLVVCWERTLTRNVMNHSPHEMQY